MAMRFSEDSLQLIVGWTIQEISQMLRHPEWYQELRYTRNAIKQLCRELGIDYAGVIESFKDPVDDEIGGGMNYVYADDGWHRS